MNSTLRKTLRSTLALLIASPLLWGTSPARAETIGEVDTAFHFTRDDRITVEAYDDPKVAGVTCYLSRARTGGVKGIVGVAEDKSEASIACRSTGPISFVPGAGALPLQEDVFTVRLSVLFKRIHVVRIVDAKRNTLVYLTYSDKLIDGSPKNSVTAVALPPELKIPVK
jgi:CreA protein